jgi:hypothetical protein
VIENPTEGERVREIVHLTHRFRSAGSRILNGTDPTQVDLLSEHLVRSEDVNGVLSVLGVVALRHTGALADRLIEVALNADEDHSPLVGSLIGRIARPEREGPAAPTVFSHVEHDPTARTLSRALRLLLWAGLPGHARSVARLGLETGGSEARNLAMRFLTTTDLSPCIAPPEQEAPASELATSGPPPRPEPSNDLDEALSLHLALSAAVATFAPHPDPALLVEIDRRRRPLDLGAYLALLEVLPADYTVAQRSFLFEQSLSQARRRHILPILNKIEPGRREELIGEFARSTFHDDPDLVMFHLIQDLLLFTGLDRASRQLAVLAMESDDEDLREAALDYC